MVKIVKKETTAKVGLPTVTDEIFKIKVDRESQKFVVDGQEAYGKFEEFTIRPLDIYTKIVAYNDDFEVTHESTLFKDLKQAKDTRGCAATDKEGKICGRVVWNNLTSTMSKEAKEENKKKAKFYALLFGIAKIGDNEPIIVDFRIGGAKFMEVVDLMKKIKADKKEYNKAEVNVKAFPNENEGFDWPEMEFTPDFSQELPVTGLDELFDTVEGYIEHHNNNIAKKVEFNKNKAANKGSYKAKTSFKL